MTLDSCLQVKARHCWSQIARFLATVRRISLGKLRRPQLCLVIRRVDVLRSRFGVGACEVSECPRLHLSNTCENEVIPWLWWWPLCTFFRRDRPNTSFNKSGERTKSSEGMSHP